MGIWIRRITIRTKTITITGTIAITIIRYNNKKAGNTNNNNNKQ